MKKRVLFVMPQYEIGGITISLYSLLSKIDPERIQADVFAAPKGPYKGKMPNCRELPQNIWLSYPYLNGCIWGRLFQTVVYGLRYVLSKVHINTFPLIHWIGGKSLQTDKYDAVVCFSEGMAYTVCSFPAKKLIQWIHCDYRRHLETNNPKFERYAYERFDAVVCVSDFVKGVFSDIYPEYAEKTIAIHNVINVEDIRAKAKDDSQLDERFKTDAFTIVSCGRLDPVKGFSSIPRLANQIKRLTDRSFRWYIIGGGFVEEKRKIEDEIKRFNLDNEVILLGFKTNAYPYIAKADLYVCTSQSESFPLVVNEAKALSIPVVSNNFPSVYESVEEGIDGYVVSLDNMPKKIVESMETPLSVPSNRINNSASLEAVYRVLGV
ncbi:MAG: glycosyltransferase [Bacteroidales bacterium]|nr:glycosyltransferase [Bacteroidales bacterium]